MLDSQTRPCFNLNMTTEITAFNLVTDGRHGLNYADGHATTSCPRRSGPDTTAEVVEALGLEIWPCPACVPMGAEIVAPTRREVENNTPQAPARGTGDPTPRMSNGDALAYAKMVALSLDRKFEIADVTETLTQAADWFTLNYVGGFEFMLEMQTARGRGGLSVGQVKGVLNCIRADAIREQAAKERAVDLPREQVSAEGVQVPDGTYSVKFADGSHRTLKVKTNKPDARFAPGETVVSYLDGPDNWSNYTGFGFLTAGRLNVWKRFQADSTLVEAVKVLIADPKAAAGAYGIESGRCGLCGRQLTVPESIEAGIGPVCAKGAGW